MQTTARAPQEAFNTPRAVDVIDPTEQMGNSTVEHVSQSPGVTSQSTNRGAGGVIIRGFVGPENLILVDGLRFNQSTFRTGPNQYLYLLPEFAFTTYEVVRGPIGTFYGNGTIGGVVNARTSLKNDETRTVFMTDSAQGETNFSTLNVTTFGDFKVSAGVGYGRAARFSGGAGESFLLSALQPDGRFLSPSFQRFGWTVAAEAVVSDATLTARYLGSFVDDAPRTDRIGGGELRTYDNVDHFVYVRMNLPTALLGDLDSAVVLHRSDERVIRANCQTTSTLDLSQDPAVPFDRVENIARCAAKDPQEFTKLRFNKDVVTTVGLSTTARREFNLFSLTIGGDVYSDFVNSNRQDSTGLNAERTDASRGNFSDESTSLLAGMFTSGRYAIFENENHTLSGYGGLRLEHNRAAADSVPGLGTVQFVDTALVGSAGLSYGYQLSTFVYANWNQGFRAPNLQETTVLGDTGNTFEIPNADLKPERANTFEIGARLRTVLGSAEPVAFVTLLNNRIARESASFEGEVEVDGKQVVRRVNRDSGYAYGVELKFESRPLLNSSIYGSIQTLDAAVETDDDGAFAPGPLHGLLGTSGKYEVFRRLPPTQYRVGLKVTPTDTLTARLFVKGAGTQRRLNSGDRSDTRICEVENGLLGLDCLGTDSWTTLNFGASYNVASLKLDVGLLNLTDARYRVHGSGVPGPGRSLRAQVTLRF